MTFGTRIGSLTAPTLTVVLACVAVNAQRAAADITGFGDYTTNWNFQQLDGGQGFAPSDNGIRLSRAEDGNQYRNYYHTTPQNITQFVASFTYRGSVTNAFQALDSGLAFVLFPNGTSANGTPSGGNTGRWGLTNSSSPPINHNALNPSVALVLGLPSADSLSNGSGAGFYANGVVGGTLAPTGPVNLGLMRGIDVSIRYNQPGDLANFLYLTLTDTFSGNTYSPAPTFLPVQSTLGTTSAFVGFTTFSRGSDQNITNFSFSSIPAPSIAGMFVMGSLVIARRRR